MERNIVQSMLKDLYDSTPGNFVTGEMAYSEEVKGMRLYAEPIFGIADASDPLFEKYKEPGIIGPWYHTPSDWLPGAKAVISIFFPFTDEVKSSNRKEKDFASLEWSYARIEGQAFLAEVAVRLAEEFKKLGYEAVAPSSDPRFFSIMSGRVSSTADSEYVTEPTDFGSSWSERHAAFAAGLGTFGMSRGLITRKGMAGRFASIIVTCPIEADERPYTDPYEYCIKCGACAKRCPSKAIPEDGPKDHMKCFPVVTASKQKLAPRYGCGLCQTGVPCESGIPKK